MAVETHFESDRDVVRIALSGDTNVAELVANYEALLPNKQFRPNMNVVWDLSRFDLRRHSINEVRQLVRELRHFARQRGDRYKAALVTSRATDYQLLRMYLTVLRLIGTQVTFKLFRSMNEAYAWLVPAKEED